MTFNASQYTIFSIPATTKLWNNLPSMIVKAVELQELNRGTNAFLLGVNGL